MGAESPDLNPELSRENFEVPKEYNFDEGFQIIVDRLQKLLDGGQKYICISVGGLTFDDQDIGKTKLGAEIAKYLYSRGIVIYSVPSRDDINSANIMLFRTDTQDEAKQGAVILNAEPSLRMTKDRIPVWRANQDRTIKEKFEPVSVPVQKIDLRIGIYRPDRPYDRKDGQGRDIFPVADIIIRNEQAKDDTRKMRKGK